LTVRAGGLELSAKLGYRGVEQSPQAGADRDFDLGALGDRPRVFISSHSRCQEVGA
jgi:hypothetical protein